MDIKRSSLCFLTLLFSFLTCNIYGDQDLHSCLLFGGVTNFTTYYQPTYTNLLHLTLQNLRFSHPSIPKPHALILPQDQWQLAAAIQCARKGSWAIRIRSGGHSFEGLSSVADTPFVIIDMSLLDQVVVDLESETAWVGGGAMLGDIYHAVATESKRHGFPAGFCPTVGSGGHLSGGGYGGLVRKYGLSSDTVLDAILVDAEGRVLNREAMGEDVFWAIRGGGGGNWGAISAWKIHLPQVPETVTALRVMRSGEVSQAAELWNKWQAVAPHLEDDFFLQVAVFGGLPNCAAITMFFLGMYLGPKLSAHASLNQAFPELGVSMVDLVEMGWIEAVLYLRGDPNVPTIDDLKNRTSFQRTYSKSKSDFVKSPIPAAGLEGALEMLAKQPKAYLLLDPLGGIMNRIPSDATAFPHRAGNLYCIEYFVDWQEEDDERSGEYSDWMKRLYEYMGKFVSEGGRSAYVNNVDLDLGVMDWENGSIWAVDNAVEVARSWGDKYFKGNYDRLVRVKTMIDPGNVFRHPQSIPPLTTLKGSVTSH